MPARPRRVSLLDALSELEARLGQATAWHAPLRWLVSALLFVTAIGASLVALLRWPFLLLRGKGKARSPAARSGTPINVDMSTLEDLRASGRWVVAEFHAKWCGPCLLMEPALKHLAAKHRRELLVVKVDCTFGSPVADRFGVTAFPTLVVFRGANEIARHVGTLSSNRLSALAETWLTEQPVGEPTDSFGSYCDPTSGQCTISPTAASQGPGTAAARRSQDAP